MKWLRKYCDRILLILVLLLTAFLAGYGIWAEGNANAYYTAAVTSMLKSWHNFFFASLDPGGFITVDKPALGFWLQCLSGLIFGVHGWSLILPEVLCSVISVAVLFHIVQRSFGKAAGLLASLFLALTPIFIAATRSNNLDASLVMVCLFALWAVIVAAEKGSLKYLLLSVALIGIGFNIKMLQAYFYVPALYLVYFFTANIRMKKRVVHLLAATIILAAVSLSWCVAVDLTPAQARPYVGSSATNSELDLAIGYNGIARVLEANTRVAGDSVLNTVLGGNSNIPNEGGQAGVLRLFNGEMAGQISWLLVLAGFGLAALAWRLLTSGRRKAEADRKTVLRQLLLWLGLFIPMAAFFSISGHFHRYYLIMFAPDLAALAAIAVCELYKRFTGKGTTGGRRWQALLLPAAILLTAASQVYYLSQWYAAYSKTVVLIAVIAVGLCLLGLAAVKLFRKDHTALAKIAVAVGIAGLLAAPAYWAYCPILYGGNASIPFAGPLDAYSMGAGGPRVDDGGPQGGAKTGPDGGQIPDGQHGGQAAVPPAGVMNTFNKFGFMGSLPDGLVSFMMSHEHGSRFLVAVPNAAAAEPIIIKYGVGVMALGGFRGSDNAISLQDFIALVQKGELQYYWLIGNNYSTISRWVEKNGARVEPSAWGGAESSGAGIGTLYDLTALKTS